MSGRLRKRLIVAIAAVLGLGAVLAPSAAAKNPHDSGSTVQMQPASDWWY